MVDVKLTTIVFFSLSAVVSNYSGRVSKVRTCVQTSPCSCTTTQGTIDLHSLASNTSTARFFDVLDSKKKDKFSWNPCFGFNESGCLNVAVCQTHDGGTYSLGTQQSAQFTFDNETEQWLLTYKTSSRNSYIFLECGNGEAVFDVQGEQQPSKFFMSLKSHHVCLEEKKPPISIGTILCIVLAVLLVSYCLFGVLIQIFVRKVSGLKAIPNSGFWSSLPGYIKSGFLFAFGKGKPKRQPYQRI